MDRNIWGGPRQKKNISDAEFAQSVKDWTETRRSRRPYIASCVTNGFARVVRLVGWGAVGWLLKKCFRGNRFIFIYL